MTIPLIHDTMINLFLSYVQDHPEKIKELIDRFVDRWIAELKAPQ